MDNKKIFFNENLVGYINLSVGYMKAGIHMCSDICVIYYILIFIPCKFPMYQISLIFWFKLRIREMKTIFSNYLQ